MELQISIPSNQGQICKIITPLDNEPYDVYIIAEDPEPFDNDDTIYVVSLNELQRNIKNPGLASRMSVEKNNLSVIADNLTEYIKSWNKNE